MGQFVIPAGAEQAPTPFDVYRQEREDGSEFWSARDLMGLMGYSQWVTFENPLKRAMKAAENQNMQVGNLFYRSLKKTAGRPQEDYELTRFAAYLVAMNGDPNKPEVASAQAYFATRTRQAETQQPAPLTGKELMARALMEAQSTIQELEAQKAEAVELSEAAMARAHVAEAEADEARPKAEAFDSFMRTDGTYYMGAVAKMLGMGQNELFRRLRKERVLIPSGHLYNTPYRQYERYFLVRPHKYVNADGREFLKHTTYVKPSGVEFIRRRLGVEAPFVSVS
nr:MAG TPA: DNA-damage-inducible protein D [Caudoviricetes sp.]